MKFEFVGARLQSNVMIFIRPIPPSNVSVPSCKAALRGAWETIGQ